MKNELEIICPKCHGDGTVYTIDPYCVGIMCEHCDGKGKLIVDAEDYFDNEYHALEMALDELVFKMSEVGMTSKEINKIVNTMTVQLIAGMLGKKQKV